MADSSQYGYPILTADDCALFFREVSISTISEEDFKKPEARRWQTFYKAILEMMLGNQVDLGSAQNRLHALAECDYVDLHQDSFHLMTFYLMLKRAMNAASVMDFSLRDLTEPRPKRLLRIISGVINFIRFRYCREEVYNKKKDDLDRKRESYDIVLKTNAEQKSILKAKQKVHEAHKIDMAQRQEEEESIASRIHDLQKSREGLQREVAEIRTELSQRTAVNDQLKVDILAAKSEGDKVSQCIIHSPDRLKTEQERAKNRITDLRVTVENKLRRLAEVQQQQEHAQQQQKSVEKAVKILRDISNDAQRQGEMGKEVQHQQDQRQDEFSALQELTTKADGLRAVHNSRQDRLAKMDLQYRSKKPSLEQERSQLAQLKESQAGLRGSGEKQEVQRLKDDTERKLREHQAKIQHSNSLYSELLRKVDKGNIEVAKNLHKLKVLGSDKC